MIKIHESFVLWKNIKKSFNYCSSGDGQNSVITVVYDALLFNLYFVTLWTLVLVA